MSRWTRVNLNSTRTGSFYLSQTLSKYWSDPILYHLCLNFNGAARLFTVPGLSQAYLFYLPHLVSLVWIKNLRFAPVIILNIYFALLIDIIDNIITNSLYIPYYVTRTSANSSAVSLSCVSRDQYTPFHFFFTVPLNNKYNQGCNVRKVNCSFVYSAYILKPVLSGRNL